MPRPATLAGSEFATGLSTGIINYHFDNKRALVVAALDQAYTLQLLMPLDATTFDALLQSVRRFVDERLIPAEDEL